MTPLPRGRAVAVSKRLSYVLRHHPGSIGLTLDDAGWVSTAALLSALAADNFQVSRDELRDVVVTSDKQRFAIDDEQDRIRANQGHSVQVDLGLAPKQPPATLFHGTIERFLPSIMRDGLLPQSRLFVHLSGDLETAAKVGARHGKPLILGMPAAAMAADGSTFFQAANGVWLIDRVPPERLRIFDGDED